MRPPFVLLVLALVQRALAGPHFRVCLVQNPGFVNCTADGDPSQFTGLEIELLGLVAQNIGWQQVSADTDVSNWTRPAYSLVCTNLRVPAVIDILTGDEASGLVCDLGMGAFTATSDRVQQGARFSWPHLHSSLGVMVAADTQRTEYNRWAFLKPFSADIWVALISATVLVPMLLLVFENLIQTGRIPVGLQLLTEWRHASYVMFLCCFNLQVLEVLSAPCQLMILCFAFTNLILVASYTANLAAVLTAAVTSAGIQNIQDLYRKNVAAHAVYVDRLARNELIRATPLSWGGEPFFLQVKDELISGSLDAYIFDKPLLQYYMGVDDKDCQLRLLMGTDVEPFDYGIAFNKQLPDSLVANFSLGVLQVQSTGMLPVLEERYLSGVASACNAADNGNYDTALQFAQVSGLYIILGTAAGLGLLASVYSIWWHHIWQPRKQKRKLRKKLAEMEQHGDEAKGAEVDDRSGHSGTCYLPVDVPPGDVTHKYAPSRTPSMQLQQPWPLEAYHDPGGPHAVGSAGHAGADASATPIHDGIAGVGSPSAACVPAQQQHNVAVSLAAQVRPGSCSSGTPAAQPPGSARSAAASAAAGSPTAATGPSAMPAQSPFPGSPMQPGSAQARGSNAPDTPSSVASPLAAHLLLARQTGSSGSRGAAAVPVGAGEPKAGASPRLAGLARAASHSVTSSGAGSGAQGGPHGKEGPARSASLSKIARALVASKRLAQQVFVVQPSKHKVPEEYPAPVPGPNVLPQHAFARAVTSLMALQREGAPQPVSSPGIVSVTNAQSFIAAGRTSRTGRTSASEFPTEFPGAIVPVPIQYVLPGATPAAQRQLSLGPSGGAQDLGVHHTVQPIHLASGGSYTSYSGYSPPGTVLLAPVQRPSAEGAGARVLRHTTSDQIPPSLHVSTDGRLMLAYDVSHLGPHWRPAAQPGHSAEQLMAQQPHQQHHGEQLRGTPPPQQQPQQRPQQPDATHVAAAAPTLASARLWQGAGDAVLKAAGGLGIKQRGQSSEYVVHADTTSNAKQEPAGPDTGNLGGDARSEAGRLMPLTAATPDVAPLQQQVQLPTHLVHATQASTHFGQQPHTQPPIAAVSQGSHEPPAAAATSTAGVGPSTPPGLCIPPTPVHHDRQQGKEGHVQQPARAGWPPAEARTVLPEPDDRGSQGASTALPMSPISAPCSPAPAALPTHAAAPGMASSSGARVP